MISFIEDNNTEEAGVWVGGHLIKLRYILLLNLVWRGAQWGFIWHGDDITAEVLAPQWAVFLLRYI